VSGNDQVLILGLGNILLGDEGVGVRVIRELERSYSFPPGVELLDGGTAGFDLLSLIEGVDHLIVIDCLEGHLEPGTIARIIPEIIPDRVLPPLSLHEAGLTEVLALAKLSGSCPQTVIFGIQPENKAYSLNLTPKVEEQIPRLIEAIFCELVRLGFLVPQDPWLSKKIPS